MPRVELVFALALASSCAREPATPPASASAPSIASPRRAAPPAAPTTAAASQPTPPAPTPPAPDATTAPPRPADFVDVATAVPDVVLDMRYATERNFTKRKLYPVARCLLRRAVAERLAKVAERLRTQGARLLLWDCYRPASIQKALWELVPDPRYVAKPSFAADGTPQGGSRHSRGAAVDASLAALDGTPLPAPTEHDDFSAAAKPSRAHRAAVGGEQARLLAAAMTAEGFVPITSEWWHFDAPDAASFGFSDEPLCAPACGAPATPETSDGASSHPPDAP